MFSILHISDLHRSREEPVDNDSLMAALVEDCERYQLEAHPVRPPDAIIVSGDLIQGAPIGRTGWQDAMRDQYRVAGEFLDHLTRRFLQNDRSRIILVPGNHDVCWNSASAAMQKVPNNEYPGDVRGALLEPDSQFRWCWKTRTLYRIQDQGGYLSRLNAYWDFVGHFYEGVALLKPIDRARGYQLFELCDRRIVVAAFDSTEGNDCYNYSGAIARGAVARCHLDLKDLGHQYDLKAAVWHHSIHGPPLRDDYMEIGQVHEMIGLKFQIGFHGHQHVAAANTHYVHIDADRSMAVVSAGSLCAGYRELPRGVDRQYNIAVFNNDLSKANLYCREMTDGGQFARKTTREFNRGHVELTWQPTTDVAGRPVDARSRNSAVCTLKAEELLRAGKSQEALRLLVEMGIPLDAYARRIAIDAAVAASDWASLIRIVGQPTSIEEAVHLVGALIKTDQLEEARKVLGKQDTIDRATRDSLTDQIHVRQAMRNL